MTLTTLVTHVEPREASPELRAALALAGAFDAHLVALVFPAAMEAAAAALPDYELARREEDFATRARAEADRQGVSCEVRPRPTAAYGVGEIMAEHLRQADMGLLALQPGAPMEQRLLVAQALFEGGRPLLLLPRGGAAPVLPPRSVVVAWDDTPAAARAVHGALPLLARAEACMVVTVSGDKEMRAAGTGEGVTRWLGRHGARARCREVARGGGSVLDALHGAAGGEGADLLVMGAHRHSTLRNMLFGSTTEDLLRDGPRIPTLLAA